MARLTWLVLGSLAACARPSLDEGNDGSDDEEDAGRELANQSPGLSSGAVPDASFRDAAVAEDAGSLGDAGLLGDAGSTDAAVIDAASTTKDASVGECSLDADCTQLCVITGVFPCCKPDQTCGCTYIPGTLCL